MCRQKGYTPERDEHVERWNLEDSSRSYQDDVYYGTSYMQNNLSAGLPIIMRNEDGQNISKNAFWGVLPRWKHTFKEAVDASWNMVNIRSETVYETKIYKELLEKGQRCLVPMTHYFEPHHFDQYGKKGQLLKTKLSAPFVVQVIRRPIFSVPALYSYWYDKENDKTLLTYSFFTIVANDLMAAVHNGGDNPFRMPLALDREEEDRWLNPKTTKRDLDDILNQQIRSDQLKVHAVAPLLGKKAKIGAAILEEELWDRKEEIEEIKNTGKQKQRKAETEPA